MSAGLIEDENRVGAGADLGSNLVEMKLHGFGVTGGQYECGTGSMLGALLPISHTLQRLGNSSQTLNTLTNKWSVCYRTDSSVAWLSRKAQTSWIPETGEGYECLYQNSETPTHADHKDACAHCRQRIGGPDNFATRALIERTRNESGISNSGIRSSRAVQSPLS